MYLVAIYRVLYFFLKAFTIYKALVKILDLVHKNTKPQNSLLYLYKRKGIVLLFVKLLIQNNLHVTFRTS